MPMMIMLSMARMRVSPVLLISETYQGGTVRHLQARQHIRQLGRLDRAQAYRAEWGVLGRRAGRHGVAVL